LGQGVVSTPVEGAGFRNGIVFKLRKAGVIAATAKSVGLTSSMQAKLLWDLTNVAVGKYDLVATNTNGEEVALAGAVEVEKSTGYKLDYYVASPQVLRYGRNAFYNVTIKNIGNVDIPFVQTQIGIPGTAEVVKVTANGNVKKRTDLNAYGDSLQLKEYIEVQDNKVLPFLSRKLNAGDEFSVTILLNKFLTSTFSVGLRADAYSTEEYVSKHYSAIEEMRQIAMYNPEYFNNNLEFRDFAQDKTAFRNLVINEYIKMGMLSAEDTVGVNTECNTCGLADAGNAGFTFSPGASPGTLYVPSATFGPNQSYLWEINRYAGTMGGNPGWDLIKTNGTIDITATPTSPFTIKLSSLNYFNKPDYLAGWYPAVDKDWPIVIAGGGITNFDSAKFLLDTSSFVAYNHTYGGRFSLKMAGTDTLMLHFSAHIPGIGEDGVPGAPGAPGEPGSPGGDGGPGDGVTPPGAGGPGGDGGPNGGTGGRGGRGGDGGPGQPGGIGGIGGIGGPGTTPGQPGGRGGDGGDGGKGGPTQPGGPQQPGGPGGQGGSGGKGGPGGGSGGPGGNGGNGGNGSGGNGSPGAPGSPGSPGGDGPGDGGPDGGPNGGPSGPGGGAPGGGSSSCNPPPPNFITCQAIPWLFGCGLTGYGCYTLFISGGAKVGAIGGALAFGVGAIAGAGVGAAVGAGAAALVCGLGIGTCVQGELTIPGKLLKKLICTPVVASCDPNEIQGPGGYSYNKLVSKDATLPYTIVYENDKTFATTSAQRVTIRQPIDEHLDASSLRLSSFGFRNMVFDAPADVSNYTTTLHLADSIGVDVNVTAGLDVVNREVFWVFQSVDPQTGLAPTDPFAGYLPINDSTMKGEGFVRYTIKPASTAQTGDSIKAQANILFDINAPISTNTAWNIIDAAAPTSKAVPTAIVEHNTVISLPIQAADEAGGSGLKTYALYYSKNNDAYQLYKDSLNTQSVSFTGTPGNTYRFFTVAMDNVGNQEALKGAPEITVTLASESPLPITWLYFEGQLKGKNVMLDWATATEQNAKSFIVERSLNGRQFSEIGTVEAKGNTGTTNKYLYADVNATDLHTKTIYYRLRQLDQNGSFTYSKVVAIPLKQGAPDIIVNAYPNPFTQSITLQVIAVTATDQTDKAELYSMEGKLLYQRRIEQKGSATVVMDDLPSLTPGVYLLKTSVNGKMYTMKMIRK
jgi:hypothetical protein